MESREAACRQARFWRKFLLLTCGRLDVLRAMDVIIAEEPDPAFRALLESLRAGLRQGEPLSDGLAQHPAVFSRAVRELITSAERTGAWDEILPLLADGLSDGTLDS